MTTPSLRACLSLSFTLFAAVAVTDCSGDPSGGEGSNLRFTVVQSAGCAGLLSTGCAIDRPLLAGVDERVRVRRGTGASSLPTNLTFTSSNLNIITLGSPEPPVTTDSEPSYFVPVHAAGVGTAYLEARASNGAIYDRVQVRVASAATIDFTNNAGMALPAMATVNLRVGERVDVIGTGRDAQGNPLFSNNVVVWTVPDTSTVRLSWGTMPKGARIADDRVYLTGVAAGTVTVTATIGTVTRALTATVAQ